jgi:glycerate 2-kinase
MRILIVPDSFKESLSARDVGNAIKRGVENCLSTAEVINIPFSDGGEGALDVLCSHAYGKLMECETYNAIGGKIRANYFMFEKQKCAWIELSQASGLAQIPLEQRDILHASTFGTGILIKDAIEKGCTQIILGIGGSATNDGGAGIFQALGGQLLDQNGKAIALGGKVLNDLDSIVAAPVDSKIKWKIACDVNNPLLGKNGATAVYGPQKGASATDIKLLESGLSNLSKCCQKKFDRNIESIVGGGAAGGTAAGMFGFFNATLEPGFSYLAEMIQLEKFVANANLIFTAEGRMDAQSINGKLTVGIARMAKKHKTPIIGLTANLQGAHESLYKEGFTAVFPIQDKPMSMKESKAEVKRLLEVAAQNTFRVFIR